MISSTNPVPEAGITTGPIQMPTTRPTPTPAPTTMPTTRPTPTPGPETGSKPVREVHRIIAGPNSNEAYIVGSGNNICRDIEPLIEPYINLARSQPVQNVGIPVHILKRDRFGKKDQVPILRLSAFVDLANGALQSNTNFRLPYIQSIYEMAGMTSSCNGIIVLKYACINPDTGQRSYYSITRTEEIYKDYKSYFYFNFDGGSDKKIYVPVVTERNNLYMFRKGDGGIYDPVPPGSIGEEYNDFFQTKFISKFLTQYNNPGCKLISIAVYLLPISGGHANMLLIYKGISKVYIMLYEPHGAEGLSMAEFRKTQYNKMNNDFIKFMQDLIESQEKERHDRREVKIVRSYQISEAIGIQRYMRDKNGYCYMITSFWLYIILSIINQREKSWRQQAVLEEKFMLNLNYIEQCVYNIVDKEIKKDKDEQENPTNATTGAASSSVPKLTVAKQGSLAKYNSSQVLNSLIVHFSYDFLTRFYMDYFKPDNEFYTIFRKSFVQMYNEEETEGSLKFHQQIFIQDMIDDHIPSEVGSEQKEMMEARANEIIPKLMADGLGCKKREDCLSKKCEDGKCVERNYNLTQSQESFQDSSQGSLSQRTTIDPVQATSLQRTSSITRQVQDEYEPLKDRAAKRVDDEVAKEVERELKNPLLDNGVEDIGYYEDLFYLSIDKGEKRPADIPDNIRRTKSIRF